MSIWNQPVNPNKKKDPSKRSILSNLFQNLMQLQNYNKTQNLSSEFSYLQKILAFNSNRSIKYLFKIPCWNEEKMQLEISKIPTNNKDYILDRIEEIQEKLQFYSYLSTERDQILDLYQTLFRISEFLNQSIFQNHIPIL